MSEALESQTVQPKAISVQEAGKLLGISKNHAYTAAQDGVIPTIRIGRRLVVPMAALDKMLNGDDKAA